LIFLEVYSEGRRVEVRKRREERAERGGGKT